MSRGSLAVRGLVKRWLAACLMGIVAGVMGDIESGRAENESDWSKVAEVRVHVSLDAESISPGDGGIVALVPARMIWEGQILDYFEIKESSSPELWVSVFVDRKAPVTQVPILVLSKSEQEALRRFADERLEAIAPGTSDESNRWKGLVPVVMDERIWWDVQGYLKEHPGQQVAEVMIWRRRDEGDVGIGGLIRGVLGYRERYRYQDEQMGNQWVVWVDYEKAKGRRALQWYWEYRNHGAEKVLGVPWVVWMESVAGVFVVLGCSRLRRAIRRRLAEG